MSENRTNAISPMQKCILLFQCQMLDTRLVTSCVGTYTLVLTSLTLVDYFSKWPEAAPLKDKTAIASVAFFAF